METDQTKSEEENPRKISEKTSREEYWPEGAGTYPYAGNECRVSDWMDLCDETEKRLGRDLTLIEASRLAAGHTIE